MASSSEYTVVPDIPDALLKVYLAQKEIAVDTELQGLRLGRDQVCLVQLSDRKQQVCLVRPEPPHAPPNLKKLLTHPQTIKVFHYALTDVAFLKLSLGIDVYPFRCTKVMSKLVRTYTDQHSLKDLVREFVGVELEKISQTSNWQRRDLSPAQLKYAANDVLHLLAVYDHLMQMLKERGKLPTGITAQEMNEHTQQALPTVVELIMNGYGDKDQGWETSLFNH
ncbi:MAG TPA: ribonuclease D [bacterium]|nr:ribonuclease D [bacterium]